MRASPDSQQRWAFRIGSSRSWRYIGTNDGENQVLSFYYLLFRSIIFPFRSIGILELRFPCDACKPPTRFRSRPWSCEWLFLNRRFVLLADAPLICAIF